MFRRVTSIMSSTVRTIFGLFVAGTILVGLSLTACGDATQSSETTSVKKNATENSTERPVDDKSEVLTLSVSEVKGFPFVHVEWRNLPQRSILVLTQHHENKNLDLVDDILNRLSYPMINHSANYEPPVGLGPWVAAIGIDAEGDLFVPIVETGSHIEAYVVRAAEIRIARPLGKWPGPSVPSKSFPFSVATAPHELTVYCGDDLDAKSFFIDVLNWQTFPVPQRTRFTFRLQRRDIFAQSAPLALHQPAVKIKYRTKP